MLTVMLTVECGFKGGGAPTVGGVLLRPPPPLFPLA